MLVWMDKDYLSYAKTLIAIRHLVWLQSPVWNLARASARGLQCQQAQVASCLPDQASKPHQVSHTYKCLAKLKWSLKHGMCGWSQNLQFQKSFLIRGKFKICPKTMYILHGEGILPRKISLALMSSIPKTTQATQRHLQACGTWCGFKVRLGKQLAT